MEMDMIWIWIIIILLAIFVIMIITIKPQNTILINKPQTQKVNCYQDNQTDLVMLPIPNPTPLTTHVTI